MSPFGPLATIAQISRTHGGLVGIVIFILQIVFIVSVLTGQGTARHKLLWAIVILLLPVLGLILYAILGRSPRDRPLLE